MWDLSKRSLILFFIFLSVSFVGIRYFIHPMFEQKNKAHVIITQHQDFVIATGSIEARNDVTLTFEEGGVVQKVLYHSGDAVEEGAIIASLNAGTLQAETEVQRSHLEKEAIRLESFVGGPEEYERARVEANTNVSERKLESEVGIALASAQHMAVTFEGMVRTEVDGLFSGTLSDPRFDMNVSAVERQRVNRIRKDMETVFLRWRAWTNSTDAHYQRVTAVLRQFEKDLRLLHDGVVEMYDILLPYRGLNNGNEKAFLLLAKLRSAVLETTVETTRLLNNITVEEAKYQYALAQGNEVLSGSTRSDRLAQSAQVDAEREKLRRLELQLAKTQIRAPFSGIIGEVLVEAGEFIPPGTESVRFVSRAGYDLSVNVTEVEIQYVSVNQEMQANVGATRDDISVRVRTVDATEKRINDVPVYTVVFDVIDEEVTLRPGMTVDVYIPSGEPIDVFAVPREAIVRKNGDHFVLVERGAEHTLVPVVVGAPIDDDTVAVTGDLRASDVVVFEQQTK